MKRKAKGRKSKRVIRAAAIVPTVTRAISPLVPVPWFQSVLAVVAGCFGSLASQAVESLVQERIEEFREDLREEFQRYLMGRKHDQQYLEAQSLAQLILLVAQAIVSEPLRDKRRLYARILCQANTPEWTGKANRIEEVLRALIDVTEADMRVLNAVIDAVRQTNRRPDSPPSQDFSLDAIRPKLPNLTPVGIKTHLVRLQRLGLLLDFPSGESNFIERGAYLQTHLLQELIELIAD